MTHQIKQALTGDEDTPAVYLGNFEVEREWASGEIGLPAVGFAGSAAIVNRMDEFALLLGGKGDHVLLKEQPDEAFLSYLEELGLDLPRILVPPAQNPGNAVTRDVLAAPDLLVALRGIGRDGARLFPHGISVLEEQLAEMTGLALAGPAASVCKKVNSKIYSRIIAARLGLRVTPGHTCGTLAEFDEAIGWARTRLRAGRTVVIKDAFGVSGKGISVVSAEHRLDQVHRMVGRQAARAGTDRVALVVEEWVDKRTDLNYQVTVGRGGEVSFDFVKEAITSDGVHLGHRFPAPLSQAQTAELIAAAQAIGTRLAADGYFGVAGMDALIDESGELYPVIEINARNNMSTYQLRLARELIDESCAVLARHYPLRLTAPLPFVRLRQMLDGLMFSVASGRGLLVNNYATVNAGRPAMPGPEFSGRLYGLVVAPTQQDCARIDNEISALIGEGVKTT